MANREHVRVVLQGADATREWRARNFGVRLDLCNVDLRGVDLRKADLRGADLRNADLSGNSWMGPDRGAWLWGADLSSADLSGANLTRAVLIGANLRGANLCGALFVFPDHDGVALKDVNLRGAILSDDTTLSPKWRRVHQIMTEGGEACDFTGEDLSQACLRGANFRGANLRQARLNGAFLQDANLSGADLSRAHVVSARLEGADLNGAELSGAILTRTFLSGAALRAANLTETDLAGTYLDGADLTQANLRGANLERSCLWGANLSGANLTGADLSSADLSTANLCDVSLGGTKFKGTRIGGTVFSACDLSETVDVDSVVHLGPSTLSTDTLTQSKGGIPTEFLRGCGFTTWQVLEAQLYGLDVTAEQFAETQSRVFQERNRGPLKARGVFISYSPADERLADKLYRWLWTEGVPVWLDRHDHVGRPRAIRRNDIVLLVLSESSIKSDWFENELDLTHRREEEGNRDVLCFVLGDKCCEDQITGTDDDGPANPLKTFQRKVKEVIRRKQKAKRVLDFSEGQADAADRQPGELLEGLAIYRESPSSAPSRHAAPPPPSAVADHVHFSVTAPLVMVAGKRYVIDVWTHLAEHRQQVLRLAREAQGGDEIRVKSKLGVEVVRGSRLSVQLGVRGLAVPEPEDTLSWYGEIANVSFPVEVPPDARADSYPGTAIIRANRVPLAKIHFVVTVGRCEARTPQAVATARQYASAFASYASRDREKVLARIQGMQKVLPDLDVFLDVVSLRSGQHWENRLVQEIIQRDVFYLFWSEAASKSPWVEREWRTALEHKGIEYIDPVPLVSPEDIAPPPELAGELHFNDWILAYMRGTN